MSNQIKVKDRNYWEVVGTLIAAPTPQKTRTGKDVTEFRLSCQPNPTRKGQVLALSVWGDQRGKLAQGDRVKITGRLVMGDKYPWVCGEDVETVEKDRTGKNYQSMLPLGHAANYRRRYR